MASQPSLFLRGLGAILLPVLASHAPHIDVHSCKSQWHSLPAVANPASKGLCEHVIGCIHMGCCLSHVNIGSWCGGQLMSPACRAVF